MKTKVMFESYYDEYMQQWSVRNTETLEMYPVTSENMANEFTNLLNKYDEKYIDEYSLRETVQTDLQRIEEENEQLKQQIKIFEKFLEGNDLSIDWDEFCGVDECAFENPDFSCKECIYLKGDVE